MTVVGLKPRPGAAGVRGAVAGVAAAGPRLWRPAGLGGLARWLWYDRPVRWQLLAAFVLINVVTGVAAGGIVIYNTRDAAAVEIAASMEVAEQVVRRTIDQLAQEPAAHPPLRALEMLPLRLRRLRHVRIAIADAAGRLVSEHPADVATGHGRHARSPRWFRTLFHLGSTRHEVPVVLAGLRLGTVLLTSQPEDEIAEVWRNVSDLAVVALVANIVVIGLFYLALGRVLNPLTSLAAGLAELQRGRLGHRLPRPRVRDLASIVDRFNALAGTLEAARADNVRLNRRLVTAQDDERRQIATELHDELGACLFGLRANVLSVERLARSLPSGAGDAIRKRIGTLVEVCERMQTTNRRVLRSLRPMAIGHAALADVIRDLVADFERHDPNHAFRLDIGPIRHGYGDCVDLTVYRCIQEGMTNAVRHAQGKAVAVTLKELTMPAPHRDGGPPLPALRLSVADDGRGLAPGAPLGLGLTGIEERVGALGGTFAISSRPGCGARLDVTIPVEGTEPGPCLRPDPVRADASEAGR